MKLLFDFFPVIVFFAAFKLSDIYVATAASIAAAFLQVGIHYVRTRRFERMHLITLVVLAVFGGMTLAFHDDTFIKWKPTIVNWVFAGLLLGGHAFGKNGVRALLGEQIVLPDPVWRRLNLSWAAFFVFLGTLNLYMAFYYGPELSAESRQAAWVNFKVFGLLGLTLAFTLAQALFLAKHIKAKED